MMMLLSDAMVGYILGYIKSTETIRFLQFANKETGYWYYCSGSAVFTNTQVAHVQHMLLF